MSTALPWYLDLLLLTAPGALALLPRTACAKGDELPGITIFRAMTFMVVPRPQFQAWPTSSHAILQSKDA